VRWTTRLWARLLWAIDVLFGTRLVERELARHQDKIERLLDQMGQLNQDLDALTTEVGLYRLAQCLVELRVRSGRDDLHDWLRFAPHQDGDEALLDSAIECLVKPRLAAIDEQPDESGGYVCRLYPDWAAIMARLGSAAVAAELLPWLQEKSQEQN
jgi:hypothetical protein